MIKPVTERPDGYRRKITHNVMFCDGCGRRIIWAPYHRKGHFCEKCLKELRQQEKDAISQNGCCK